MNRESTIKLLVILGPTATGKSDLAVALAKKIEKEKIGGYKGAEIISADSRQVYRGMNIGTGKITNKEMSGVPHHLLDVVDPKKQFTVIEFKRLAAQAILDIVSRGKLPIICGGTGFYIDTLLNDEDLPKVEADMELRKKLSDKTVDQLFEMLLKLDPERARGMNESDNKNPRRLIRAVEVAIATAVKSTTSSLVRIKKSGRQQLACTDQVVDKSTSQFARVQLSPKIEYTPIIIGLQLPNEQLRQRIGNRLLRRINAGMINEARKLHKSIPVGGAGVSWKRMEELGLEYRYMARYLQGKITKDEMTKQLETEIWHYAKRQMTWFKRNEKIKWFEAGQVIDIEKYYTQIFLSKRA